MTKESFGAPAIKKANWSVAEAIEYWTPERKAQAVPTRPRPLRSKGEKRQPIIPPWVAQAKVLHPAELPLSPQPARVLTPHLNPNPGDYPYRTCGRLFFKRGETPRVASGAVISNHVVLIAGSTLFDEFDGGWATFFAFEPGTPALNLTFFPTYHAQWDEWVKDELLSANYAMLWFNEHLSEIIPGNLGLLLSSPIGASCEAIGYPFRPSPTYDGRMHSVKGVSIALSGVVGEFAMTNNDMQDGSTGGPWIIDFNGGPYVIGIQARSETDSIASSPMFTEDAGRLFNFISTHHP